MARGGGTPRRREKGERPFPARFGFAPSPVRGFLFFFLCLAASPSLPAQAEFTDSILQGELWMPFEAIVPGEIGRRIPDEERLDALLEEMQTVFSGMIYGWSFTYRPADPDRKVAEFLDVVPLGRIVGTSGDPATARAMAVDTRIDERAGTLAVTFRYLMPPFEAARRLAWASSDLEQAAGTGKSRTSDAQDNRLDALHQAVKEAVRNLLRPKYHNRPQEIRGEALLREVPRFAVQSGRYVCSAQFQMRILKVREYPLY